MEKQKQRFSILAWVSVCLALLVSMPSVQAGGIGDALTSARMYKSNATILKERRKAQASKNPKAAESAPSHSMVSFLAEKMISATEQVSQWGGQVQNYVSNALDKSDVSGKTVHSQPVVRPVQNVVRSGSL